MQATVWYVGGEDVHMRIPLLLELRRRGFAIGVVGSEENKPFRRNNIPYFRYPLRRGVSPLGDVYAWWKLYQLFKRRQPGIIHCFDTKPIIFGPTAARIAGIHGRVRTVTGMGYVFSSRSILATVLKPAYRVFQRWAGSSSNVTIFQNPDDRDYFLTHRMVEEGYDALVLGSGIDYEQFWESCRRGQDPESLRKTLDLQGDLVVTMIARLVKDKGVREYVEAAAHVRRHFPKAKFLLVGPIASEGRRAVSVRELTSASDNVRYLGPRKDVAALMGITDVFVLPSYYREGVPRVLLEAAAAGLPLITTNMPGCKEVVRHGWNGLLIPPRDSEALSLAILELLASNETRERMGRRSRKHVANFGIADVADRYSEIYARFLSGHQRESVETRRS